MYNERVLRIGDFSTLSQVSIKALRYYDELGLLKPALRWVAASGYRVAGPIRELYLHCPEPVRQDDESYVTQIQVPVERA